MILLHLLSTVLPSDAHVTIRAPFIVVQGELIADLTTSTVTSEPRVKFVLIGDDINANHNVTEIIHPMNQPACHGTLHLASLFTTHLAQFACNGRAH